MVGRRRPTRIRALTDRQQLILEHMATPMTMKEIALATKLSRMTVINVSQDIAGKLFCETGTRIEIVVTAIKYGYLDVDDVHVGMDNVVRKQPS